MPRTNIQPRHHRRDEYFSPQWTEFLLSSCRHLDALVAGLAELCTVDDAGRLAALRDAWDVRRDDMLPQWIASHPGTRPPAWWLVDAPELRRWISGGHPEQGGGRNIYAIAPPGCQRMFLKWKEPAPAYESERDYLERLGLLSEGER